MSFTVEKHLLLSVCCSNWCLVGHRLFFTGCSVSLPLTATSVMTVNVVTLTMSLMRFPSLNFGRSKTRLAERANEPVTFHLPHKIIDQTDLWNETLTQQDDHMKTVPEIRFCVSLCTHLIDTLCLLDG